MSKEQILLKLKSAQEPSFLERFDDSEKSERAKSDCLTMIKAISSLDDMDFKNFKKSLQMDSDSLEEKIYSKLEEILPGKTENELCNMIARVDTILRMVN